MCELLNYWMWGSLASMPPHASAFYESGVVYRLHPNFQDGSRKSRPLHCGYFIFSALANPTWYASVREIKKIQN